MASVLGQLLVELGVNTGAFKSGLDKATYQAREFAKDVKQSFSEIGESIKGMASELGLLSPAMSGAVSGMLNALGPLTGNVKTASQGLGVLAAAGAGVGLAAIALAAHTAETAEKLYNLTQATGLSVSTLSGLSLVAKTVGVDTEQLGRGLERMARSAFTAAQTGSTTNNAYRTLGISILDTNGKLRSQSDIFSDVATKFSAMENGTTKTALAMQIFGRSGAELIPVLNLGGEKVNEMVGHLTKLGAVITDDVAEASEELRQKIQLLGAGFTGVENRLLTALVPALSVFTNQLISGLENGQGQLTAFINGIADVAKVVLNVFQIVGAVIGLIGQAFQFTAEEAITLGRTLGGVYERLSKGDIKGAWQNVEQGALAAGIGAETYWSDATKKIKESISGIGSVWTAALPKNAPVKARSEEPSPVDTSFIDKEVQALQQRAIAAQGAASANSAMSQSEIDAAAAAQAHAAIQKLVDQATIKNIENTRTFKDALDAAIPKIQAAAQWEQTFKAAISDQAAFDNFNKKINEQITALQGEAAASGAVAQQWAKNQATLKPLSDALAALNGEYKELSARYGEQDPRVKALGDKVTQLTNEYSAAAVSVGVLNKAFQDKAINDAEQKINDELTALKGTTAALVAGGEGYAKIDEQVKKFATDTKASAAEQEKFRQTLIDINAEQQKQGALKLASPGNSAEAQNLKLQLGYLEDIKAEWVAQKKDITPVQQAINQVGAEIAGVVAKTGTYADGVHKAFADFIKDAQSQGAIADKILSQGLKGLSENFSDMVVDGKAKWGDLIHSMEKMLLQSTINSALAGLFKGLGGSSGIGGFFSGLFGPPHASGGDVSPGKAYLVGEQGPELFAPGGTGTIIPNHVLSSTGSGKTSVHVTNNFHFPNSNPDEFIRSQSQVGNAVHKTMQNANARNS
jgi:hypothetical protein